MEVDVKTEDDDDMDLEDMLKKELEGMSGAKKSNRFRECFLCWVDLMLFYRFMST